MEMAWQDQSMVGLMVWSQGSPRITFSLPQDMMWKRCFCTTPSMLVKRVQVKWISLFLFEVWSTFCTLIGISSFVVERECFLTNCQLMQEMSVLRIIVSISDILFLTMILDMV